MKGQMRGGKKKSGSEKAENGGGNTGGKRRDIEKDTGTDVGGRGYTADESRRGRWKDTGTEKCREKKKKK